MKINYIHKQTIRCTIVIEFDVMHILYLIYYEFLIARHPNRTFYVVIIYIA